MEPYRGQKILALNNGFIVLRNCTASRTFLTHFFNLAFVPDSDCWVAEHPQEQARMNACLLATLRPGLDYYVLPCDGFNGYGGEGGPGGGMNEHVPAGHPETRAGLLRPPVRRLQRVRGGRGGDERVPAGHPETRAGLLRPPV